MLTSTLILLLNGLMAQDFCFTDNFKKFQNEKKISCKNLMITDLSFIDNGKFNLSGQITILDSIALNFARNEYIYEIDYETRDKKISADKISEIERSVRNYLISRNGANQAKVFQETHDKIDHSPYLPENSQDALFFLVFYPANTIQK